MLRLHSYILWSMLKFFHIKSQHYILCMIYVYKGGGTHTVVCTAHLYSVKHTVVFVWSSWGVKYQATSSLFSLFFQHKFDFFSKTYLTMGDAYKRLRGGADFSPFPLRGGAAVAPPPSPPPPLGGGGWRQLWLWLGFHS